MFGLKRRLANFTERAVGAHVIPKTGLHHWLEVHFLGSLLVALDVDCVFDVGANKGQFGRLLRECGYRGTILSFEPGPAAYAELTTATKADANWATFNMALGAEETTMPLNVMASDDFSSFQTPTDKEEAQWRDGNKVAAVVDVAVRPLFDILPELYQDFNFERPFLKMDTQGFDLEVIKGAGNKVLEFVALSTEIAIRKLYEESPSMEESVRAVTAAGFEFINLMPVHANRILNPVELNSYAVRRDLASKTPRRQ